MTPRVVTDFVLKQKIKQASCPGHLHGQTLHLSYCRKRIDIWRWQVHASSYKSNKLTNQMQQFYMFITWHFVSLNMFRVPPRLSSGAYNCISSLWFYRWSVVVATVKPEAVNAVVSSWWWTWTRPKFVERHKTSSNKLVKLLHLVG